MENEKGEIKSIEPEKRKCKLFDYHLIIGFYTFYQSNNIKYFFKRRDSE